MRKKLLAVVSVAALGLAGCQPIWQDNELNTSAIVQNVQQIVAAVQKVTVTACGFLPTAGTIASIVTNSTAVLTAHQIAEKICSVVVPPVGKLASGTKLKAAPMVVVIEGKEIPVNGWFVQK